MIKEQINFFGLKSCILSAFSEIHRNGFTPFCSVVRLDETQVLGFWKEP